MTLIPYARQYNQNPPAIRRRSKSELAKTYDRGQKIEYLTDDEYLALLRAVDEYPASKPEHLLLIKLLYQTGLRITEALTLDRANIYPDGIMVLHGKGPVKTGGKQRFVPAQTQLLGELIRYQDTHGQPRIFQKITTKEAANYMVKKYARLAGIQKRVHPHLFRHSFAINLLRQTGNPFALQDIGGWSDMETIKIYMRLAKEQPREVIARMVFPEVR
jgi:integrase/recombinase XerD